MSEEYGIRLNPMRKTRKPHGIQGERMTITHNPDTANPNTVLTVRFPDLDPRDVINLRNISKINV